MPPHTHIVVRGAAEHNLQHVHVTLPRESLIVLTGLSGSGKSSLAFDTIYAEGQRRYIESLSSYARQFLDQLQKPRVDSIDGLSPAISIEQKTVGHNPRSTVGTVTEVYDYLRVLYANVGQVFCPETGMPMQRQTPERIVETVQSWPQGTKLMVLAPVVRGRKGEYRQIFEDARRQGYTRAVVNGDIVEIDMPPLLKKTAKHDIAIVIDRLFVAPNTATRLAESIGVALRKADGAVQIMTLPDEHIHFYSTKLSSPATGKSFEEITHRLFSFNSPYGWCEACKGLGTTREVDVQALIPNPEASLSTGALLQWAESLDEADSARHGHWDMELLAAIAKEHKFSLHTPWSKIPAAAQNILLYGSGEKSYRISFKSGHAGSMPWEGLVPRVERRLGDDHAAELDAFLRKVPCPTCQGLRLRPEALAVRIGSKNISEFCQLDIRQALQYISTVALTPRQRQVGALLLKEITDRLRFLDRVGLHYLALDRPAGTLSGGEAQRTRLATQIGSQLNGVLYVLDEPSIGLHQRDNELLIQTLQDLRDMGNTVIVVEHDEHTIRAADYVVDLGPGAGRLGGHVVAEGTPDFVAAAPASITGQYLRGEVSIATPRHRRSPEAGRVVTVHGARENNLRDLTVQFPLGVFTCVTGVSGSGKSTLINDILYRALANELNGAHYRPGAHKKITGLEHLDKVIEVDQSPIGRTPRSNPATYTGLFGPIRDLFAQLPESQVRGYKPGRFSFNVKGGRCEHCTGDGLMKIEMHFLPDVYVQCEICHGRRYNRETLEVVFKGKNIADVLEMTVDEAVEFFENVPQILPKVRTLQQVGLGYITLGQSATTLSGGEAQRIKLSKELGRRATGRTIYILDEPTTGLHFEDVRKLLEVLQALVAQGNTVIVIEHNLDVMKSADWILDLGPEGGEAGGQLIAEGTPEQLAKMKNNTTGRWLKTVLGSKTR